MGRTCWGGRARGLRPLKVGAHAPGAGRQLARGMRDAGRGARFREVLSWRPAGRALLGEGATLFKETSRRPGTVWEKGLEGDAEVWGRDGRNRSL